MSMFLYSNEYFLVTWSFMLNTRVNLEIVELSYIYF